MDGIFYKQGVSSFFLLNMEATLYLFFTSFLTYVVFRIIVRLYVRSLLITSTFDADKELNLIEKALIKKKEGFEWDKLPR